ncbi:hypothetical protein HXX76_007677 [Chlamydomonas incerta]|uniref:Glycosyl transferase CAP10 domain-containing protein n=1 Tax=Chlamydomonas incerta TaxID=51695 RepID=A0A835T0F5_CHLIN|nr:hypothetical protein HXX76_007677 [Chlamydomonas incerta]|eukprot:KAG2434792.1 hypothetical protein HXX76_007677 [Chlamydomonas incerta]
MADRLAKLLALALTWSLYSLCEGHAGLRYVHASGGDRRVLRETGTPGTPDSGDTVREVPLSHYAWSEVVDSLEGLLEAALGPEVAYWRTRGVTCEDVVDTVTRLHSVFLDSVKVVLIRNNTWHFLHPASRQGATSGPGAGKRARSSGATPSRYNWPELEPTAFGECPQPCQAQLQAVYDTVARRLHRTRGAADPPYHLPDMVFVVNAADNMQRFGLYSRAPVLSLLKRWEVPWWGSNSTAPSLGRSPSSGELLAAMPLPSRVQQALDGAAAPANAAAAGLEDRGARSRAAGGGAVKTGRLGGGGAAGLAGSGRSSKRRKKKSKPSARRAMQQAARREAEAAAAAGRLEGPGGSRRPSALGAEGVAGSAGGSGLGTHSAERSRGLRRRQRQLDAATAAGTEGGAAAADGEGVGGDKLWDMVRRFVASRPPDLPPGVQTPNRLHAPPPPGGRGLHAKKPAYDMDLLLPTMAFVPRTLVMFPWERKKDVAFFSGVPFCPLYVDPHRVCPRVFLANLSSLRPDVLDARLVRPWNNKRLGAVGVFRRPVTLKPHPPTPMPDHARYRWLLNVDGLSASTRMGFLMTTDSVVLKSRSPFIEYYSRLQTPGSHYLEFWSNASDPYDVLGVVAAARATAAADPAAVAAAVAANQAIAARYIALQPKLLYARSALLAYHSLVPDMAQCVEDLAAALGRQ